MAAVKLEVGGKYNFKCQRERLIYMGQSGCWYQFSRTEKPGEVWSEVLLSDMHLIEETEG